MIDKDTILVTGGAGFIGGNFVLRQIRNGGVSLVNLDALTYAGNLDTLASVDNNSNHQFVLGSITDRALVDYLLDRYRPRALINFAAESHVDRSIDTPDIFIKTNVVGTFELLEAARTYWSRLPKQDQEAFRFVHVSTDEVYGSLGETGRFTETTPYRPNSPYAASKASSDHFVRAYFHTFGLPVITTNCSNNYGPYQFPEKLIPLLIQRACNGDTLPVYGTGQNIRDWIFVEDHCRAIECVLESGMPGEVYNIGGNNEQSNLNVVTQVCGLLDEFLADSTNSPHAQLIEFVQDRPGHDFRYSIDASKIQRELHWTPSETFETGLRKTIQWYLDHTTWCQRVLDGSYRGERLGLTGAEE